MNNFSILDCTLRDGGYYTSWDFDPCLVEQYLKVMNNLPVDYLEIGYRSPRLENQYLGKYFYLPVETIREIKTICEKKICIILNEKDIKVTDIHDLLEPCREYVTMVRLAVHPKNLKRAASLIDPIKAMGFEICFNVMYMSTWLDDHTFLKNLEIVNHGLDYFYMVDSYGGVFPDQLKVIYNSVSSVLNAKIGFHGHNNMELALINSLTAIECGVDIVDCTITGMGRGAGNLKTELLLTTLNQKTNLEIDFNNLSQIVTSFKVLQSKFRWGTNLPYMVSGAYSLPQKQVMEWVTKRFYSYNSIIQALQNQKENREDNLRINVFKEYKDFENVLIIGGGVSPEHHKSAIKQFIKSQSNICIIHASSKNAGFFKDVHVPQYFCLVGNEGYRLEEILQGLGGFQGKCVLPPYPRKMGTYIPALVRDKSYELEKVSFTQLLNDSHTVLALQTSVEVRSKNVYLVGYDGYMGENISQAERTLATENEKLFEDFKKFTGQNLVALTPTNYQNLLEESVYGFI